MKYFLGFLIFLMSSSILADENGKVLVDQNAKYQDAYVVMQADIINPDQFFNQYAFFAEKVVAAYGGVAKIAALNSATTFEGNWSNNWTLMLNFPSIDAAKNWYYSSEYQSLIPIRKAASAYGNMVLTGSAPKSIINWSIVTYENKEPTIIFPNTLDPNPEYIIGVKSNSVFAEDKFSLQAEFPEVDVTYAQVSGEIRVLSPQNGGVSEVSVYAIDTAGNKLLLTKMKTAHSEQWKSFSYKIDRKKRAKFNPKKLRKIVFKFTNYFVSEGSYMEVKNVKVFE